MGVHTSPSVILANPKRRGASKQLLATPKRLTMSIEHKAYLRSPYLTESPRCRCRCLEGGRKGVDTGEFITGKLEFGVTGLPTENHSRN